MMMRRGRRGVGEWQVVWQQPLQRLLHTTPMLDRRQDALLQLGLPALPGEAAGEADLLELVHLEPQERIGRLDLGRIHSGRLLGRLGALASFDAPPRSQRTDQGGTTGSRWSAGLHPPGCFSCVAMEVERDSEEGAFVIEDVSAIIKEVRPPARPAGPRSALFRHP